MCAVDTILPHIPQTNCLDKVRHMQAEDNIVGPVLEAVGRGKDQGWTCPNPGVGRAILCYYNGTHLSVCNCAWGALRCSSAEGKKECQQLVLPCMHRKVIRIYTIGAHLGEEKGIMVQFLHLVHPCVIFAEQSLPHFLFTGNGDTRGL